MLDERLQQDGLLRSIAKVGSLQYQMRECLGGTADHYLLLDEFLEATIYAAEHDASHPVLSKKWTAEQQQALLSFAQEASAWFDQIGWQDPKISLDQIIHSHPMQRIREAAGDCLRRIGASFTWEELLRD